MDASLNLSNEVIRMRAEVKRVKVMVIRKLTRQIGALKKKKGTEADLNRNQRRAARLLEEIREIKTLSLDTVTKTALQEDISFEKVFQNKDATLTERATARIATYPDFSKKIRSLKDAIQAFKKDRRNEAKKAKKELKDSIQKQRDPELDSESERGLESNIKSEDGKDLKGEKDNEDDDVLKEATKEKNDSTEKKSSETGSLLTEVVRMRKEVKKLRTLIISKLTQQISSLKKAKAEEAELKENQECAARLLKEVQVLRGLVPDHVTKAALQGDIDLEKVLEDPKSSPLERAIARIATHPRFIKKLQQVQEAVKEERTKAEQAEQKNKGGEDFRELSKEDDGKVEESDDKDEEEEKDENKGAATDDSDSDDGNNDDIENKERNVEDRALTVITSDYSVKPAEEAKPAAVAFSLKEKSPTKTLKEEPSKQSVKDPANKFLEPLSQAEALQDLPSGSKGTPLKTPKDIQPETKKPIKKVEENESESDLSDGDEEKEYFDDSTEERFHKQSSLSEDSDEDDFFIGKVSKLKKKKRSSSTSGEKKKCEPEKRGDPEQDDKKAGETSKPFNMQSVFCSTLSKSGGASQKGKTPKGPPRFQNQRKRRESDEKPSWFKSQGPPSDRKPSEDPRPEGSGSRQIKRQAANKGTAGKFSSRPQHSQQAIHPSWEASKKRKEQLAQITAFQGKKIKFDDDD